MTIAGWGHVSEATLADLADGLTAVSQLSPSERRHLDTCDRCQSLLEGHRRAGRLLAAEWKVVSLGEVALNGAPVRVVQRVVAGHLVGGGRQTSRQLQLLTTLAVIAVLAVGGFMLWNSSAMLIGGPGDGPSPSPSLASALTPAPPSDAPAWEFRPQHVAVDALGRVYTTDCGRGSVFQVGDPGRPVLIAGNGRSTGFGGDGGPATEALLECPYGLAFDVAGNLFVADTGNNRVRMVDSAGIITTIAGSGPAGWANTTPTSFSGDGGPATEATLRNPAGIALDAEGNLYIADMRHRRIRVVDTDGIITTIAGDGTLYPSPSFGGDGGPAIEAMLNDPQGIAVDGDGNLYFVDTHNNRVRMIDPAGIITTIAGTGEFASDGDEGPAVEAALAAPRALLLDGDGNVYVSEAVWDVILSEPAVPAGVGNRVRRIDTDGIIHAFAGTGEVGFAGDGGPAIEARLNGANENFGLAIDSAGNVYIADSKNDRIRVVDRAGIITTFADGSP